MAELQVNTAQQRAHYRGFTIEESIDGWEWCHKDYSENGISGICDTIFDAIDAVDKWWENGDEH